MAGISNFLLNRVHQKSKIKHIRPLQNLHILEQGGGHAFVYVAIESAVLRCFGLKSFIDIECFCLKERAF